MASGKKHAEATRMNIVAGAMVAAGLSLLFPVPAVWAACTGLVSGLIGGHLVTPDIDQRNVTFEERRMLRFFRPFGWFWRLYWYPYSLLMLHRGWSHTVPQGTLSRILYMVVPPAILASVLAYFLHVEDVVRLDAGLLLYLLLATFVLFLGWCVQDLTHLALDGEFPAHAPWRRPAWQPADD